MTLSPLHSRPFGFAAPIWRVLSALLGGLVPAAGVFGAEPRPVSAGPLVQEFRLTLESGRRREAVGPFWFAEEAGDRAGFGLPPLFSWTTDAGVEGAELDVLYPLASLDRFGSEYRWHILQLFSFSGGRMIRDGEAKERFTVFPFYFQQRAADPALNYTALLPFYGHLKERLLRDEIFFVMFPVYAQTRKRDVVTDNYLYPFFHLRHGDGLAGWQFWPLVGTESKAVTTRTNSFEEVEIVPGHEKRFVLWPFAANQRTGLGTENPDHSYAVLPLWSVQRSPQRDSTTVLWPFFTFTDDRAQKYREWDLPWPFIVFARPTGEAGETPLVLKRGPARYFGSGHGKTVNRVFPFFGQAYTDTLHNEFFLWPLYLGRHVNAPPLERHRHRFLLFLYSDLEEKNLDTGKAFRRTDVWPLFTWRSDREGRERLQVFAPVEPMLPGNKSVERNWSPLWSLWRAERNGATGAASQSLLWNLWRREVTPETKKCSLLFGLFQYQTSADGARWRLFYLPFRQSAGPADAGRQP